MLDPYIGAWAAEAGLPADQLSSIFGGNILGGLIGMPFDLFLTQLGAKLAETFLGGIGLLLGTYTFKGQGRLQVDTIQVGAKLFSMFLDPSPQQIAEIQKNIGSVVDGIVYGRWDKVLYGFVRNPREFQTMIPPLPPRPAGSNSSNSSPRSQPPPAVPSGNNNAGDQTVSAFSSGCSVK
jgi:hypothetical protein